ncbi:protein SPO16 homolog [Chanos chanos]|uniref:Protein SPO16 homolog n=1 Tax=Chanos chanos TaxID=29144 RepID=A0A6J2WQ55_CHACN|nr:uncharacterized protein C1orf146 homolog [Chanos chanos]
MANSDPATSWKTTVIISTTLKNHEISAMLSAQRHRIRFSDEVEPEALIFCPSGTAFMVITPQEFPETLENVKLFEKIEKFVKVHQNCFILLPAQVYGQKEWDIVAVIQNRFFGSNLGILPVHKNADMVKGMLTIAKVTSKPYADSVRDRISLVRAHLIKHSPAWDMLKGLQSS